MKKILFVFAMVMMLAFSVQSSEALSYVSQEAYYPDGNMAIFLDMYEFAYGGLHMPINVYNDGTLSAVVLDYDGFPVLHLFMYSNGFIDCSTDGWNWADCSAF